LNVLKRKYLKFKLWNIKYSDIIESWEYQEEREAFYSKPFEVMSFCLKGSKEDLHFKKCYPDYELSLTFHDLLYEEGMIAVGDYGTFHVDNKQSYFLPFLKLPKEIFGENYTLYYSENYVIPMRITAKHSNYVFFLAPKFDDVGFEVPSGFKRITGCKCPAIIKSKEEKREIKRKEIE
jgi:hypothetical protein